MGVMKRWVVPGVLGVMAVTVGPIYVDARAATATVVKVEALPGALVRWSVPGTKRCGMGSRSWAALQETCYYPIDLMQAPATLRVSRRGVGPAAYAQISVLASTHAREDIALGGIPQANPSSGGPEAQHARPGAGGQGLRAARGAGPVHAAPGAARERVAGRQGLRLRVVLRRQARVVGSAQRGGLRPRRRHACHGRRGWDGGACRGLVLHGQCRVRRPRRRARQHVLPPLRAEGAGRAGRQEGRASRSRGRTGRVTGPHLHLGMRWHDARVEPRLLLGDPAKIPAIGP